MRISRNYTTEELCHSDSAERYGIINQITTFEQREAMFALVRKVLQPLRDLWGKPLYVQSGFRCSELNAREGGKEGGQCTLAECAVLDAGSTEGAERLVRLIRETPDIWNEIDQCIVYAKSVSVSHKRTGRQRQTIIYDKSYKGKRI